MDESTATPEERFLADVRAAGMPARYDDAAVRELGQQLCADMYQGAIPGDLVQTVQPVAGDAASAIVAHSELKLCPDVSEVAPIPSDG